MLNKWHKTNPLLFIALFSFFSKAQYFFQKQQPQVPKDCQNPAQSFREVPFIQPNITSWLLHFQYCSFRFLWRCSSSSWAFPISILHFLYQWSTTIEWVLFGQSTWSWPVVPFSSCKPTFHGISDRLPLSPWSKLQNLLVRTLLDGSMEEELKNCQKVVGVHLWTKPRIRRHRAHLSHAHELSSQTDWTNASSTSFSS